MAMKIQARLPEPEELKQKYPMSADMKKIKDGMERFRMYSPGIPINFLLSSDHAPQITKMQSANT